MSTEWYLMKPPYSQTSGFEEDAMDFAQDAFEEVLDSPIAIMVEYCNADLSICSPIKAIIQNKVQDTKLNAFTRHLLVPVGSCKAGYYIKYKNRYWLIVGLVDDNSMYEKAVLKLCNWKLAWINQEGKIIERWSNIESASQYNNGQTDNRFFTIRTDQLLICMPDDDECLLLDSGKRFIIDKRIKVYERNIGDDVSSVTSYKVITYQLTRNDSVLYNYIDSGHYEILVTQDEQHNGDGFYRIGENGYWLCPEAEHEEEIHDIPSGDDEEIVSQKIVCDEAKIYLGLGSGEFTAVFYDAEGHIIEGEAHWTIVCDFKDKLQVDYINNTILISVNDYALLNKSFELFLNNDEETKLTIQIVGLI
jgi:hypothetical protein